MEIKRVKGVILEKNNLIEFVLQQQEFVAYEDENSPHGCIRQCASIVNTTSTVFSLGQTLYSLLCGGVCFLSPVFRMPDLLGTVDHQ